MKKQILDIYIRKFGFDHDKNRPICRARQKYFLDRSAGANKAENYYVWRLLQIACDKSLGLDVDSLNPRQLETGKWVIDDYYISLSHSGSYVMVGVSTSPVGVDIQKIREIDVDYFIKNEMCEEEIEYYSNMEAWKHYFEHTEKDSVYKCFGTGPLEWKKINTLKYKNMLYAGERGDYVYSICSELIAKGINPNICIQRYGSIEYVQVKH